MKKLILFIGFCLVEVLQASPTSHEEHQIVPKEVYDEAFVRYEGDHEIVDIIVPLNAINFAATDGDSEQNPETVKDVTVFFVEADIQDGKVEHKGLYRFKNNETKLILATGRTAATSTNNNKLVFFGASDGLYVYNVDTNAADKYGSITDGIISIVCDDTGNTIHILTDDHKVYKVTNNGETKEEVRDIEDAQYMVVDDEGVIYYYNSKNEVFIKTDDGIVKARNLPDHPQWVRLVRPPFVFSDSIIVLSDNDIYNVYVNGTSEKIIVSFNTESRPTAFGPEAMFAQYYGYNKKLYEFNMLGKKNNEHLNKMRHVTEMISESTNKNRHRLIGKKHD